MGIFSPRGGAADVAALKRAKGELDDLGREERKRGVRNETPQYLAANRKVEEAGKRLSEFQRWVHGG